MDKKSLIGLGLIAAILITWLALTGPSKEQIARNKQIKDSIELATKSAQIAEEAKAAAKKIAAANDTTTKVVLSDSLIQLQKNSIYKDFAVSVSGKKEVVTIENENIKAFISTKGGNVEKVILKNYKRYGQSEPLVLFDADSTAQYLQFEAYANNMRFTTDSFYFKPSSITETVSGNNSKSIILKLETSNPGSYIEYIYSLKGNDYMLDYDVNFVGMQNILSSKNNHVTMHWSQALPSQEKHITKEREAATAYFNQTNEGVDYINARKSEEKLLNEDNIKWVSFKQHFFNSTLIADGEFLKEGSFVKTSENPESKYVKTITTVLSIPFKHSSSEKFGMSFYFGPTQYNTLKEYDLDLEKIIPLGWSVFSYINKWMIIPLFSLLSGLNSGIIILILTLILKTLLFPIAYKTYMSSAKMRVLKPEIDELNAKFEKVDDPLKKQQETMALYRRAGANPLSGCLPMLLQFPILIALFGFFPAAIELRQKGFLWTDDLSTYDSVYNFGFNVWGFGDHVSLFAILMFASTIIYTWMNQAMLQPQQTQMPGMKYMMYLMPVIFLAVMNSYAAGLSWYYFLANIITFLQTWLMRKFIDDGKIREEL
ncbi:MAG TPA: membrane protein insertase YidC, partial [Bacteroidia bacterium]|nr:membrane protein insertase YidC [Bacteroidia bacterium]